MFDWSAASLPVQVVMAAAVARRSGRGGSSFARSACGSRRPRRPNEFEERFWSGADLAQLYPRSESNAASRKAWRRLRRRFPRVRAHAPAPRRTRAPCSKAASAPCAWRCRAKSTSLEHTSTISPRSARSARTWACSAPCGESWLLSRAWPTVKEATIAMVAPGISEALIATAMGLFAAIPAVWAYNRFSTRSSASSVRYETFRRSSAPSCSARPTRTTEHHGDRAAAVAATAGKSSRPRSTSCLTST